MRDPSGGFFFARPAFCDVACWRHKADMLNASTNVHFQGQCRHRLLWAFRIYEYVP